ncbi:hypothetical protein OIN60_14080 [Paenibacillus sp. P96]|uniref:N-acetyltransferase domain-containing protein n=1 Tax=Paenibacillus zeirhizosphaerae TaxID=2987519 RepID=A0ABT9FT82_9BACL|nr:hypothetical protein [Paenibacillus sp. P96]MDP4097900.1 hypothetical protein [Paenibacillus sp. P96]
MIHVVSILSYPPDKWPLFRRKLLYMAYSCSDTLSHRNQIKEILLLTTEQLRQPGSALVCGYVRTELGPELAGFSLMLGYGTRASIVAVRPVYREHRLGARLFRAVLKQSSGKLEEPVSHNHTKYSVKAGEALCSSLS